MANNPPLLLKKRPLEMQPRPTVKGRSGNDSPAEGLGLWHTFLPCLTIQPKDQVSALVKKSSSGSGGLSVMEENKTAAACHSRNPLLEDEELPLNVKQPGARHGIPAESLPF